MLINQDGAEIEYIKDPEVFGEWIRFTDENDAHIKIAPAVVLKLMVFALEHIQDFDPELWDTTAQDEWMQFEGTKP
jgi:hypothetical protein